MADRFRALFRVATAVSASLDLDEILRTACQAAVDLLGPRHSGDTHSAIALFSPNLTFGTVLAEFPNLGATGRIQLNGVPVEDELLDSRRPVVIRDVVSDERLGPLRERLLNLGIRSSLFVPVMAGDRILGSFSLDSIGQPREFLDDEIELCEGLAAQIAAAIENARLFDETKRWAAQLESLRRATLEYTSLLHADLGIGREALLSKIVQKGVELLEGRSGGIYDYDAAKGLLTVIADHNRPEHRGKQLGVGQGMAGRLVQSNQSYLSVHDYRIWSDRSDVFSNDSFEAVVEVPLIWLGRTVGVLYVEDKASREFTPGDVNLLRMFADQAAIALVTARVVPVSLPSGIAAEPSLESELVRATREVLTGLGTTTLDQRLALIAREAARMLNAEVCQVLLANRPCVLSVEASYGHKEGSFKKGHDLQIRTGPKTGLIGHIAHEGKVFRAHGHELTGHPATRGLPPEHLPSGRCCSLLAIPLFDEAAKEGGLLGLLQVENKLCPTGEPALEAGFSDEDTRNAQMFAKAVVTAITSERLLANWREALETAGHRNGLLAGLVLSLQNLHADKEVRDLERDLVGAAVKLVGYSTAYLYEHDVRLQRLRVLVTHQHVAEGDDHWEPFAREVAHSAVRTKSSLMRRDEGAAHAAQSAHVDSTVTMIATLIEPHDQIEYVLVLVDAGLSVRFPENDQDILQLFATRAAALLSESRARNFERRLFERAAVAHRASEYILHTSDVDRCLAVLLTSLTAGYGFGLNRAGALLLDGRRELLEGRLGVGFQDEKAARTAWDRHVTDGMESLDAFFKHLEARGHISTPIDKEIRAVRLSVAEPRVTALLKTLRAGPLQISSTEFAQTMPEELVRIFQPVSEMLIVPLAWHDTVIGVVVGDNAFTRSTFSDEDVTSVARLATTTAIAIDQLEKPRSLTQEQIAKLEEMEDAFEREQGGADLRTVERQFVTGALSIFQGCAAMFWFYDALTDQFGLRECAGNVPDHVREYLQKNPPRHGQTAYTIKERRWMGVMDLDQACDQGLIPATTRDALAQFGVRSFQGVALTVGDELLGVLYINYDRSRSFSQDDRDSLVSFANQAALTLKKARMLHQVLRARDTAQAVAKLSTLDDLGQTLRSVVRETSRALECHAVTLYEYNAETDRLSHPPQMWGVNDEAGATSRPGVGPTSIVRRMLDEDRERIADDAATDEFFGPTRFRSSEKILSCVGIPLRVGTTRVGVMFVNYRTPHRFTHDERVNIRLFADQAAVAIRSAQLYQKVQQQAKAMEASYSASQTVMGSLDIEQILDRIAEQAWHLAGITGEEPSFASVTLVSDGGSSTLNTFPKNVVPLLRALRSSTGGDQDTCAPIGLVRRAIRDGAVVFVENLALAPDYVPLLELKSGSAIVVPIRIDGRVVGAIDVEHPAVGALRKAELQALEGLALHAGIAVKNVQQHTALAGARAREEVAVGLAALGIVSKEWGHVVHKIGDTLELGLGRARGSIVDLVELSGTNEKAALILARLEQEMASIEDLVPRIKHPPVMETPDQNVRSIGVEQFLVDFVASNQYPLKDVASIDVSLAIELDEQTSVQANSAWLEQVFKHLVGNAMAAMEGQTKKHLTLSARQRGSAVEIDVIDTGKGISPDRRATILTKRTQKRAGEQGLGMGLLLARTLAQIYGGEISIPDHPVGEPGATVRVTLPVVEVGDESRLGSNTRFPQ